MKVKIMLDDDAIMPTKAHEADAGFDLYAPFNFSIGINSLTRAVDTGVHIQIPEGYVGFIKSKSGLNVKHGITADGVIDSGYTGSIVANLRLDASREHYQFKRGDKITQLVILPIPAVELELTDSFEETERGNGGFGSSGR